MGSENPPNPTLTRNSFSFEKLSGMFALAKAPRTAAVLDFAGDNDDLPFTDSGSVGDIPRHSVSVSSDDGKEGQQPRRRRISAPLVPYVPREEEGSGHQVADVSPAMRRRVSHGDQPLSPPAKTGMILNWLAYKPMPACAQINEDQEVDGGQQATVTRMPPSSHDQRTAMDLPITRAVKSMEGLSKCRKKTAATREFNVIAPSNW